jgi:plasmid stability protein
VATPTERHRMIFEAPETVKRAIRIRAAMEGVSPAAVINNALEAFLSKELSTVRAMTGGNDSDRYQPQKPGRKSRGA